MTDGSGGYELGTSRIRRTRNHHQSEVEFVDTVASDFSWYLGDQVLHAIVLCKSWSGRVWAARSWMPGLANPSTTLATSSRYTRLVWIEALVRDRELHEADEYGRRSDPITDLTDLQVSVMRHHDRSKSVFDPFIGYNCYLCKTLTRIANSPILTCATWIVRPSSADGSAVFSDVRG